VRITVAQLRRIINEEVKKYYFGGSSPEERYEVELLDDPGFLAPSVYVPNDVKEKIKSWAVQMGLSTSGKKDAVLGKKTKV
jgi:hypothetical protein